MFYLKEDKYVSIYFHIWGRLYAADEMRMQ